VAPFPLRALAVNHDHPLNGSQANGGSETGIFEPLKVERTQPNAHNQKIAVTKQFM
jgi:hypothetical protein